MYSCTYIAIKSLHVRVYISLQKVSRLEIEVAQGGTHTSTLRVDQPSLTASKVWLESSHYVHVRYVRRIVVVYLSVLTGSVSLTTNYASVGQ